MNMWFLVLLIGFLVSLGANAYLLTVKPEISVENGLKQLKKSLVRMIVFYQSQYSGSDNLVFMAKWLDVIRKKRHEINDEQMKLYKELVKEL